MLFGFKNRRTAEILKRMAGRQGGSGRASQSQLKHLPQPLRNRTLWLAKTTTAHASGATEEVDIYLEDETDLEFTLEAKNQFGDLAADEWVLIGKPGGTWMVFPLPGGSFKYGVLDGDLDAPSGVTGTPETATVSEYSYSSGTGLISDSTSNFTLTNFDPSLEGSTGAFVIAAELASGIWFPIWIGCVAQNEIQTISITGSPTGGTFKLTIFGSETAAISYDATAATIAAELAALTPFASGDISGSGGPLTTDDVAIEFQGDYEETDIPQLVVSDNSLTGGTSPEVEIVETQKGCCN